MPTFNVNSVDWDELYNGAALERAGNPGWNIGELQPELAALERQGRFRSPVLATPGCGVGVATSCLPQKDMTPSASTFPAAPSSELGAQQPVAVRTSNLASPTSRNRQGTKIIDTVVDGLVFHCLPEQLRNGYIESSARALRPGGRFFALVFSTDAFPPNADFGPRPFTEPELRETVGRHLIVDEVRPARAWVNVPRTLPDGFEYRNVTIGSDGRAQLPSFLVSAHRS